MQLLSEETPLGQYVVEKLLSDEGNVSYIYLAHLASNKEKKVALKVQRLEPQDDVDLSIFLKLESQTLNDLRHPNIVRILPIQIGNDRSEYLVKGPNEAWYLAMEYIPGKTLQMYIKEQLAPRLNMFSQKQPPSLDWKIDLLYQTAITVNYMHQRGYAHGDIKPDNIMLRSAPDKKKIPYPVLIDFGSVINMKNANSRPPTYNKGYSPPEVVLAAEKKDIPIDQFNFRPDKIDIWALGALFYEILCGLPLIDNKQRRNILATMENTELNYISLVDRKQDIPKKLDALVHRMIARDPNKRPSLKQIIMAMEMAIDVSGPLRISESLE